MRALALIPMLLLFGACSTNEAANNAMDVDENLATESNMAEEVEEGPLIFCPIIEDRATQDDCDDFNALAADVHPSSSALDVPQPMIRGKTYTVTLVIDRTIPEPAPPPPPTDTGNDIAENATDADVVENMDATLDAGNAVDTGDDDAPTANEVVANLPGADVPFQAKVGRYMSAELIGSGFTIRQISPADPLQEIPRGDQAQWKWEVVPQKGGQLDLTVKTQAFGIVNGIRKPLGNASTSKSVQVEVGWGDRLRDLLGGIPGWLALVTGILVAVGALLAAWLKIRKSWRDRNK